MYVLYQTKKDLLITFLEIIKNCLDKTSKFILSFIMFTYIFLLSYNEITLLILRQWRYHIVCQW